MKKNTNSLRQATFTHRNHSFICENCQKEVPPLKAGCRNHCPFCLTSKHVDINPGDRAEDCHGLMKAVNYKLDAKKGIVLTFKCLSCGKYARNKAAYEDAFEADNYQKILSLSAISPL